MTIGALTDDELAEIERTSMFRGRDQSEAVRPLIADLRAAREEIARLRRLAEQHGQCSDCEMDMAVEGHAADCARGVP